MSEHDPQRLRRLLEAFFESRGPKLSADSLKLWLDALSDLSIDQIEKGIRLFNRESKDYPTPAAIRDYALDGINIQDRALVAFSVFRQALRQSRGVDADFADPIIKPVVRALGGWVQLAETPSDQFGFVQKRFVDTYVAMHRAGVGGEKPVSGYLAREHAHARLNLGIERVDPDVRYIGEEDG